MNNNGVKYSPSWREADMIVIMGLKGTNVAYGPSNMFLADGNFEKLWEVRRIYV